MRHADHAPSHAMRFVERAAVSIGLCSALVLAGCATQVSSAAGDRYRCEQGIAFSVRFVDDSALIDSNNTANGAGGSDVLFRDAGGTTPQQTVFSNGRVRAEFGLGETGREAVLRYPLLPMVLRCVKA